MKGGTVSSYEVEQQIWAKWPKALVVHKKTAGRVTESRKYKAERFCRLVEVEPHDWECDECGVGFDWQSSDPPSGNFCANCGAAIVECVVYPKEKLETIYEIKKWWHGASFEERKSYLKKIGELEGVSEPIEVDSIEAQIIKSLDGWTVGRWVVEGANDGN